MLNQQPRPTWTLKTAAGDSVRIRKPYDGSTRRDINILLDVKGETFGIILSPEDARELAATLKEVVDGK